MPSQLSAVQGDTAIYRLTVTNADGTPLLVAPFDITFTIKRSRQDSDSAAVYQATLNDNISFVSGDTASVDVEVDTSGMRPGRPYYWDLQLADDVHIFTPCSGTIFVTGQVTNG